MEFESNPQELMNIVQAFTDDVPAFFWITFIYGFVALALCIILIVQLIKVPAQDFFLVKGSIFLCLMTAGRSSTSFWLFYEYKQLSDDELFNRPKAFGVLCTMLTIELPLYFLLIVLFSLLFSTYKLYLVIREMLGFNEKKEDILNTLEEEDEEVQQQNAAVEPQRTTSLLSKISNTIHYNQGSRFFRHTLRNPLFVTAISYVVDFIIIACMCTKFVSGLIGVRDAYHNKNDNSLVYNSFYTATIIQQFC